VRPPGESPQSTGTGKGSTLTYTNKLLLSTAGSTSSTGEFPFDAMAQGGYRGSLGESGAPPHADVCRFCMQHRVLWWAAPAAIDLTTQIFHIPRALRVVGHQCSLLWWHAGTTFGRVAIGFGSSVNGFSLNESRRWSVCNMTANSPLNTSAGTADAMVLNGDLSASRKATPGPAPGLG
jgi:hypothetical protein